MNMIPTVAFWALLAFGVPLLIGELFKLLCAAVLAAGIGEHWKRIPEAVLDIVGGAASVAAAGVLAGWMGVAFSLWVPVVIIAMLFVWLGSRGELKAVVPSGFGVALGYAAWHLWL
jgi:hypothetical protein